MGIKIEEIREKKEKSKEKPKKEKGRGPPFAYR